MEDNPSLTQLSLSLFSIFYFQNQTRLMIKISLLQDERTYSVTYDDDGTVTSISMFNK